MRTDRITFALPRAIKQAFDELCHETGSSISFRIREMMLNELRGADRMPAGFTTWKGAYEADYTAKGTARPGRPRSK